MDIFNLSNRIDHDTDYPYESRIKDNASVRQDSIEEIHFHPVEKRSARLTLTVLFSHGMHKPRVVALNLIGSFLGSELL